MLLLITALFSCNRETPPVMPDFTKIPYEKLSDYHFFSGNLKDLAPNNRVIPYDLKTPLFTDYAHKARFVWMPEGVSARYKEDGILDFPDKTILIKTFYYPEDFSKPNENKQIVETRLLIKNNNEWQSYNYLWNESMTEAVLDIVGETRKVSWKDEKGEKREIQYLVPNKNQCKSCHNFKETLQPIGPKARNLNKSFPYASGGSQNQLERWTKEGYLTGLGQKVPFMSTWNEEKDGTLQQRAMAYLDINCAHCHNPDGPGGSSGLSLRYDEKDLHDVGLCKSPVASGRGSAGLYFDIHPAFPDSSILLSRMISTNPGEMMPEVGRTVVHEEGAKLIRDWIQSMEGNCKVK